MAPRLVAADNVRNALALVERGEVPAGIVYATDARISKRVVVIGSGAGGLSTAITARKHGASVVVIEKDVAIGQASEPGLDPLVGRAAPGCDQGRSDRRMSARASFAFALTLLVTSPALADEYVWLEGEDAQQHTFNQHSWYTGSDVRKDLLSPGTPGGAAGAVCSSRRNWLMYRS